MVGRTFFLVNFSLRSSYNKPHHYKRWIYATVTVTKGHITAKKKDVNTQFYNSLEPSLSCSKRSIFLWSRACEWRPRYCQDEL